MSLRESSNRYSILNPLVLKSPKICGILKADEPKWWRQFQRKRTWSYLLLYNEKDKSWAVETHTKIATVDPVI
jgi:hypothetical protein